MTNEHYLDAIRTVLHEQLNNVHLDAYGPAARLNEDLYLDSVLVLELLLGLELRFGLTVPEEIIGRQDFETVADLITAFEPVVPASNETLASASAESEAGLGVHGEDYIDIKVHCFVSNVCHAVKQRPELDHRPFFFGVWDADFAITQNGTLAYHTEQINHDFFRYWFQRLYGPEVSQWYDPLRSKEENLAVMLDILETKRPGQYLMVMLDLFHLPERENKFNQNPFPHYLMLEKTADPDIWFVNDPDFRWEGEMERQKIIHAIGQPTVGGGFLFDSAEMRMPRDEDIRDYFLACFQENQNPLTDATRRIVVRHLGAEGGAVLKNLAAALRELPVISIRKYALEHGFAYFWRAMKLPNAEFDIICDEIETLIQGFKSLHYAIMKLSQTGDRALASAVHERLDSVDAIERKLKRKLSETYRLWCVSRGIAANPLCNGKDEVAA